MDTTEIYPIEWYYPYQMAFHEYYDPVWYEKSDYEIYNPDEDEGGSRIFLTSENQFFITASGEQFICKF